MGATDLLNDLTVGIDDLKNTINEAQAASGLSRSTIDNVVELAILRCFALFEHFIEELFYLCLLGDPSIPGVKPQLAIASRTEAELVMLTSGDRRVAYLSWLPFERVITMADMYLVDHPFDRVRYRRTELSSLAELTIVRNATAHPESPAMAKLRELAASRGYPNRRPADFLLSTRGGQLEALLFAARIEVIGAALVAPSNAAANALLEPEASFPAAQRAPAGEFQCRGCTLIAINGAAGPVGPCPSCDVRGPCPACGKTPPATSVWDRLIR